MFVQVIQGTITDRSEARAALDRWSDQLGPQADGWLGSTAGVTADGMFIALARFESEEAARANSERPEQHQWWMETSKLFSGDVTFHDCQEAIEFMGGGSDDAGFVQVMQYRVEDIGRWREMNEQMEGLDDIRPDVMGGTIAMHGDGHMTQAVYFTSEAAAREGEQQEIPPEMKESMEEDMALMNDMTYLDISEPWLYSPR